MQSTQSENLHVQIVHSGTTRIIHAPLSAGVDRLFTGGDDSLVRILPTLPVPGVEPLLIEDATEAVTWIDADAKYLVTGSDDGHVRLYRHQPTDSEGKTVSPTLLQALLRRESLPVRCVALERSVRLGKTPRAAVCSDEMIIKIIDVADPRRIQLLDGHVRGLRSASWSPVAPILITCSTDGNVRVNDLSDVEPKFVAAIPGILPVTSAESDEACVACWHPSGSFFVLPSKAHELVVISAQNDSSAWQRTGSFVASSSGSVTAPSGSINALAFCPNGRYLAVGTSDGQVTIWETSSKQAIRAQKADGLVTGISWHPSKDALAWTDIEGTLARWSDVLGPNHPSPFEHVQHDVRQAARGSKHQIDSIFAGTGLSDDEGEDNDVGRVHDEVEDLDDFVIDDEGHGHYTKSKSRPSYRARIDGREGGNSMMVATTRPQPPFQPTSTPMRSQRRYLAYNLLGTVVAVEHDSHQTISFESFDVSARRNFRFTDHNSLSMASMAKQGILLAGKQSGDHPGSVYFKPFTLGSGSLSSEWTFNLDHGEDVDAIALGGSGLRTVSDDEWAEEDAANAGHGIAVIATSKGYLRFLTTSGMQIYLWALGHQVVTLAAGARSLLIVYRNTGSASGGYQDLHYKLIDLVSFDVMQQDVLPLSKDTHLRWVGFSDQHQPAFYDSNETLFVLDRAHRCRQGRWVPMLDTKSVNQIESESGERTASTLNYWPVAVTSRKLMALFLKGGRSHPEVDGTRHLMQELELRVPLIHREGGTGPLEEKSLQDSMLALTARDVKNAGIECMAGDSGEGEQLDPTTLEMGSDKALLQLIQLACKADKHARALDAARGLHSTRTLDAALKIAAFFHLSSLAERMMALKDGLEGRPDRVEDESRRWCDPAVRGGPSYSNPILLNIMTRSHDRAQDSNASAASIRKRASAALGQSFLPPSASSPAPAASSPIRVDDVGKENTYRGVVGQKRKSPEQDHHGDYDSYLDQDNESSHDYGQSPLTTAASPVPMAAMAAPKVAKAAKSSNPFARTSSINVSAAASGGARDKQMHKSTSFFERIEPFEKESMTKASAPLSASASRQAKLSGFAFKKDLAAQTAATTAAAARGELGDTQDLDMGTETQDESLRAMLSHAQEVDPAPSL